MSAASLGVELLQAEVAGPLALRWLLQGGPQAVQVVASVTVITEEKLVLPNTTNIVLKGQVHFTVQADKTMVTVIIRQLDSYASNFKQTMPGMKKMGLLAPCNSLYLYFTKDS